MLNAPHMWHSIKKWEYFIFGGVGGLISRDQKGITPILKSFTLFAYIARLVVGIRFRQKVVCPAQSLNLHTLRLIAVAF